MNYSSLICKPLTIRYFYQCCLAEGIDMLALQMDGNIEKSYKF